MYTRIYINMNIYLHDQLCIHPCVYVNVHMCVCVYIDMITNRYMIPVALMGHGLYQTNTRYIICIYKIIINNTPTCFSIPTSSPKLKNTRSMQDVPTKTLFGIVLVEVIHLR